MTEAFWIDLLLLEDSGPSETQSLGPVKQILF